MASILFGASVVAVRIAVQQIPPFSLAALRFGLGSIVLLILVGLSGRMRKLARADVLFVVLLGVVLFALFPLTFNLGLQRTQAGRGALFLATMPLFSMLLGRRGATEALKPQQAGGVLLTVLGVLILLTERGLSLSGGVQALLGDGLMALTAFWGALYGVLAKKIVGKYGAGALTTYAMIFGTLVLLPFACWEGFPVAWVSSTKLVGCVLFVGALGGGVGYFLWTFGLTRLSPTQVAVYVNLNPLVATALGAAFLQERLSLMFAVALLLVTSGVLLVNFDFARRGRA